MDAAPRGVLQQSSRVNQPWAGAAAAARQPWAVAEKRGVKKPAISAGGSGGTREGHLSTDALSEHTVATMPAPSAISSLTGRSLDLSAAVQQLAAKIRSTADASSPTRRPPPPEEDSESQRRRTLELEMQLETHSWIPHHQPLLLQQPALQSSPVPTHDGGSTRLSFVPQVQQWESMARRRVDGSGTEAQVGRLWHQKCGDSGVHEFHT